MSRASETGQNSRAVAAKILAQWLETDEFPDRLIARVDRDRAFIMELVFGVVRQKRLLEWVLRRYVLRTPRPGVWACLLIGVYQLLLLDNVIEYAAINETVGAARIMTGQRQADFVNGVLRALQRERTRIEKEMENLPLGVRWSHPDILVDRWRRCFGEARTRELCQWNNTRPQVTIRANRARTDIEKLRARLAAAGIQAEPHPFAPKEFLVLPHGVGVRELPGFNEGLFSVQDPSTAVAPALLDPQPGERVLDACAAPGGKTVILAEKMGGQGILWAVDVAEERLVRLRENLTRMKLAWVRVAAADATDVARLEQLAGGRFDRILLDVPCTNTGVLRRRPDARWTFSLTRLAAILKMQQALLDAAARLLKPGGVLVYSTCSLEPQENSLMVKDWLAAHREFRLSKTVELFPVETRTDGIFAAALWSGSAH